MPVFFIILLAEIYVKVVTVDGIPVSSMHHQNYSRLKVFSERKQYQIEENPTIRMPK